MEAKCIYVEKKQSVDTGIIIRKKKGIKVFKVKVQVSKWKQVVERKSNSWKVKAICGKWKQTVKIWKRNVYMWK